MAFIDFFTQLMKSSQGGRRRVDPREVDGQLLKKAESDPTVSVDAVYLKHSGEIKGHKFTLKDGRVITTRYNEGEIEGSVGIIEPEKPRLGQSGKPQLKKINQDFICVA